MKPKLYQTSIGSPSGAVLMLSEILGIDLNVIEINLMENENLREDYIKMNPQHTVPCLDDEGKIIWDSHAINIYLSSKFGKENSLYPIDVHRRALIDEMLHFDSVIVFSFLRREFQAVFYDGVKFVKKEVKERAIELYNILEKVLNGHKWIVGNDLTLADISLLNSYTAMGLFVPLNREKYPNIASWMSRGRDMPAYQVVKEGQKKLENIMYSLMKKPW